MGQNMQNMGQGRDPAFPRLLGGRLCLDFANTVENVLGAHPEEFLTDYAALARWSRHVGLLDDYATALLLDEAARWPEDAAAVYADALDLRAAITAIFRASAHGDTPDADDLEQLQRSYLTALARARLSPQGGGYIWDWPGADTDAALDRPLWLVAASATTLLTTGDLTRVRQCPGANDCGWLFYDTSRNGSRRWCSMEGCGSRVKMRQQYAKKRGTGVGSTQ